MVQQGDPLLTLFCRHADTGNWLSKLIEAEPRKPADLRRLDRLLAMRAREDALLLSIATKMRLTPQARATQEDDQLEIPAFLRRQAN